MSRQRDRPVGRRPGDPDVTREAILDAARVAFGAVGFDRATIRAIAADAGVDPALVMHHFGTKQQLFAAAHSLPIDMPMLVQAVQAVPISQRGEFLTNLYLGLFAAQGSPMLSLLRAAATNEDAARMLREFIEDAVLSHADELAPGPDSRLRLATAASHLIGTIVGRVLLGVAPLADAELDELVALISPSIQRYLDDPSIT
jgi:AcrR family transcriptional regulator